MPTKMIDKIMTELQEPNGGQHSFLAGNDVSRFNANVIRSPCCSGCVDAPGVTVDDYCYYFHQGQFRRRPDKVYSLKTSHQTQQGRTSIALPNENSELSPCMEDKFHLAGPGMEPQA